MGFYFEMQKAGGTEFAEGKTPGVFWTLYVFLGFALLCMGLAAHALLGDLARSGDWFDVALVWMLYACAPLYVGIGLWLGFVRRFVKTESGTLIVGRRFGSRPFWQKRISKPEITAIALVNRRPAENNAPLHHDDSQYYIKGHWRVVAWRKNAKPVTLDKHTEREMLVPMEADLTAWLRG